MPRPPAAPPVATGPAAGPWPDPTPWPLLPAGAGRDARGVLTLGGVPVDVIAHEHGTPALVVDEPHLRATARRLRDAVARHWPRGRVVFASKAFPCTAVYRVAAEEGLWVDVAGLGELHLALAAGVPADRVVVHGNAKTDAEVRAALEARVGLVVVDNADDVERLARLAPGAGRTCDDPQAVLVRLVPGVSPGTHDAMDTGQDASKFGLPLPQAAEVATRIAAGPVLRLDGVHVHIGSQVFDPAPFAQAPQVLGALLDDPRAGVLARPRVVDLGGGYGVACTRQDPDPGVEEFVDALAAGYAASSLPADAVVMVEPGRSLVARAGVSLYRVTGVKRTARTFVAVDGGMGDNLEVSLYGQGFEAVAGAPDPRTRRPERCDVVGRHCEQGDRLVADAHLPRPAVGDLVAVPATGAYTFTMQNNYNGALRPPVVFVGDGRHRAVVRRETLDDLTRRDL